MFVRLFFCLFLLLPGLAVGDDRIATLEETALHRNNLQPNLKQHSCRISFDNLDALARTARLPAGSPLPEVPSLARHWQSNRQELVTTINTQPTQAERILLETLAQILRSGLDDALIPEGLTEQRQKIAAQATVKTAETQLGQTLLKRIEFTFDTPATLQEAFYTQHIPLPQDQISSLYFDVDVSNHTIQEVGLRTAEGLTLTLEMRYQEVPGGHLPARMKITSPDGQIDDLIEVTYETVEGFDLPAKLSRVINRPGQQETLVITFDNYRINQPFPVTVQKQFGLLQ